MTLFCLRSPLPRSIFQLHCPHLGLQAIRHDAFYRVGLSVISRINPRGPDYFRVLRHNFRSLGL